MYLELIRSNTEMSLTAIGASSLHCSASAATQEPRILLLSKKIIDGDDHRLRVLLGCYTSRKKPSQLSRLPLLQTKTFAPCTITILL